MCVYFTLGLNNVERTLVVLVLYVELAWAAIENVVCESRIQ